MAEHVYEQQDRHMSDSEILKRTWVYIKPHAYKLFLVLLVLIVMIFINLATSILPGIITSSLGSISDKFKDQTITLDDMKPIFTICIILISLNLTNSAFIYITTMSLQRIGQGIIYDLRLMVFEHIDNMSISQINEIPVGSLVTRVSSDTNTLSDLFTNTIVNLIKNVLMLCGVIVVMYLIDWRIASILMCFLPVIAISSLIFSSFVLSLSTEVSKELLVSSSLESTNLIELLALATASSSSTICFCRLAFTVLI